MSKNQAQNDRYEVIDGGGRLQYRWEMFFFSNSCLTSNFKIILLISIINKSHEKYEILILSQFNFFLKNKGRSFRVRKRKHLIGGKKGGVKLKIVFKCRITLT